MNLPIPNQEKNRQPEDLNKAGFGAELVLGEVPNTSASLEEVSTVEALLPLFRIFIEIDRRLKRQERERRLGVVSHEIAETLPTPETIHF